MLYLLKFAAFASNIIALLSAIWIVVPAPHPYLWLFSVAASEWSLWLAALALGGIVSALAVRRFESSNFWVVLMIAGIAALLISLYPPISAISVAANEKVSLSLKRYFSAISPAQSATENFQTYTFAQIGGQDLQMDVYAPTAANANNGAGIVVVHGGSWRGGVRDDFPQWNEWLAANGFTVFDVDYRLTQPNYQTATGDVKCAVRQVKNHAAEFDIATDRIALLGRSAGAHLALLAAYSAGDARFPATCAEDAQTDETVRAVVSLYAPVDLLWAFDNPANEAVIDGKATLADFLGGNPHESNEMRERYVSASPLSHVSAATPPTLLIHGGHDQLVRSENMRFLDERLTQANVPHQTIFIPYAQHGFDYNFYGFGSQIAQPAMLDFLNRYTAVK
ncbi:MAG: alpha/beta hydrolase [Acidobacteriota bacterium]|nr:alpha/beta hydrolase [Acidobacteriota bacterium]